MPLIQSTTKRNGVKKKDDERYPLDECQKSNKKIIITRSNNKRKIGSE